MQVLGVAKVAPPPPGQPPKMMVVSPNFLVAKAPATQSLTPYANTETFRVLEARFAKAGELTFQENGGLILYLRFNRKVKATDILLRNLVVNVWTVIEGKEVRANNVPMVRVRAAQDPGGWVYYCGSQKALREYTKRVEGQDIRCELTVRSGKDSLAQLRSDAGELLDGENDQVPGGDYNTWFQARGETLWRTGGTIWGTPNWPPPGILKNSK